MNINELDKKYLFTNLEKEILAYLDAHRDELPDLSIRELANHCYASTGAIIKLAKKLNCSGYTELIAKFSEDSTTQPTLEQQPLRKTMGVLEEMLADKQEQFSALLKKHQESTLLILSTGFSSHVANYMYDTLIIKGYRASVRKHLQMIEVADESNLLIFVISESGETTIIKELIASAFAKNIDIIAFTANPNSTIAKQATLSFDWDLYNPLLSDAANVPHLFFGSTLLLFEYLIHHHQSHREDE